jgi:hypothetical protein|mmetsp:Transcript_26805/g.25670  ORF Transcript_26805/g.25670 Transcript_26805/m.25670 type:complete len:214 (+) Transcript_26805:74-715(+)
MNCFASGRVMMNATSKIRSNIQAHKKTFFSTNQVYKGKNNKWVVISGFSRFASRTDLEICLGDVKPHSVDPLLDANLFPNGKWAFQLGEGDTFHKLRNHLNNTPENKDIKVVQADSATMLGERAFDNNISNRTVRFRNVHRDIGPDEIAFFLQDFDLEKSAHAIRSIINQKDPNGRSHYLVNFATSEEAERVVFEKSFAMFEGIPVQMFWYHC